jgi:hypothetical protein
VRGEDTEVPARVESVFPVFVDGTGRRRRFVTLLGWLVAVSCVAYLGVIGISMSGTSVGPLPEVPSVASNTVVFGSEVDALPQGALEFPVAVPAVEPQAAAPVVAFANPVKKAVVAPAPSTALGSTKVTQPKATTSKATTSKATTSKSTTSTATASNGTASKSTASSSPVRMRGTSQ